MLFPLHLFTHERSKRPSTFPSIDFPRRVGLKQTRKIHSTPPLAVASLIMNNFPQWIRRGGTPSHHGNHPSGSHSPCDAARFFPFFPIRPISTTCYIHCAFIHWLEPMNGCGEKKSNFDPDSRYD